MNLFYTIVLLASVIHNEASEVVADKWMVVNSIGNRHAEQSAEFGTGDWRAIIMKPAAYSFQWDDIPNKPINSVQERQSWLEAFTIASLYLAGVNPNPAPGVLWYHHERLGLGLSEADYICHGGKVGKHNWFYKCLKEKNNVWINE